MARRAGRSEGYARGRATRERIVHRAVEVFARQGYRGGSLKEVADGIGLSQAGLLHHFASKQELLAEVLTRLHRCQPDGAVGPEGQPAAAGWGSLRGAERLAAAHADDPLLAQLEVTLAAEAVAEDHPGRDHFVARYDQCRSIVRSHVAQAQRSGDVDVRLDPDVVAVMLLALLDGVRVQWLLDPDAVDMPVALRAFLTLIRDPSRRAAGIGELGPAGQGGEVGPGPYRGGSGRADGPPGSPGG